jgi:hypothetical protein
LKSLGLRNQRCSGSIKATDPKVTVNTVLKFIYEGGDSGFIGITKRGTFTNITIFTEDGVARVENGNVNAIWREREK